MMTEDVPVADELSDTPIPFEGDTVTIGLDEKRSFGHSESPLAILHERGEKDTHFMGSTGPSGSLMRLRAYSPSLENLNVLTATDEHGIGHA